MVSLEIFMWLLIEVLFSIKRRNNDLVPSNGSLVHIRDSSLNASNEGTICTLEGEISSFEIRLGNVVLFLMRGANWSANIDSIVSGHSRNTRHSAHHPLGAYHVTLRHQRLKQAAREILRSNIQSELTRSEVPWNS